MKEMITWFAIIGVAIWFISVSHDTSITKIYIPKQEKIINEEKNVSEIGEGSLNMEIPNIITLKICNNEPDEIGVCDISNGTIPENTLWVYWEVLRGKGCCATFNCNYELFMGSCWNNGNKLFVFIYDGIEIPMNFSDYSYKCEKRLPWNWWRIDNILPGTHNVTIEYYDCGKEIVDKDIIFFELSEVDGKWLLMRK